LKSVAFPVPEIIGGTQKIWAVPGYAHSLGETRFEVGWESGVQEHKTEIFLKREKVKEKLLWMAYRNSLTLFRTVPSTASSSPRLGVRNPHPKLQSLSHTTFNWCRNRKTSELIEWIELHVLLGVSEIFLYVTSSQNISKVLESYDIDQSGVQLTAIPWNFPPNRMISYFNQLESVNDCVYRAALRHHYVTVSDLDEVLVPRQPGGWPKFVVDVGNDSDVGAFLFQHVYFRRNSTSSPLSAYRRRQSPDLITVQSVWRTDVVTPPDRIGCKVHVACRPVCTAAVARPMLLVQLNDHYDQV